MLDMKTATPIFAFIFVILFSAPSFAADKAKAKPKPKAEAAEKEKPVVAKDYNFIFSGVKWSDTKKTVGKRLTDKLGFGFVVEVEIPTDKGSERKYKKKKLPLTSKTFVEPIISPNTLFLSLFWSGSQESKDLDQEYKTLWAECQPDKKLTWIDYDTSGNSYLWRRDKESTALISSVEVIYSRFTGKMITYTVTFSDKAGDLVTESVKAMEEKYGPATITRLKSRFWIGKNQHAVFDGTLKFQNKRNLLEHCSVVEKKQIQIEEKNKKQIDKLF